MEGRVRLFIRTEETISVNLDNVVQDILNASSSNIEDLVNEFKDTYETIEDGDIDIITDSIMDDIYLEEYLPKYLPENIDNNSIDWDTTEYWNDQVLDEIRAIINNKVEEVINKYNNELF